MSKGDAQKIRDAFVTATQETFSDMAFIDVEATEARDGALGLSHVTYLTFSEPESGAVALFLPYDCKRLIVENIYGAEWESVGAEAIDDCLLELLNVLAGEFLAEFFGADRRREVSLPTLLFDESSITDDGGKFTSYHFEAEGIPFKAALRMD